MPLPGRGHWFESSSAHHLGAARRIPTSGRTDYLTGKSTDIGNGIVIWDQGRFDKGTGSS
jgi:hypothetical protein